MTRNKSMVLIAGAALAFVAVQQLASKPQNDDAARVADFGFGLRIAGCWYGQFQPAIPDAPPLPVVFTLNADGTAVVVSPEMHGAGDPAFLGLRTTFHMVYKRTGIRETTWTGIDFAMDENGNLGVPSLLGAGIVRISGVGKFDKRFESYTGEGIVEAFMADQDPLDADEVPVVSFPISYQWRRLNVL